MANEVYTASSPGNPSELGVWFFTLLHVVGKLGGARAALAPASILSRRCPLPIAIRSQGQWPDVGESILCPTSHLVSFQPAPAPVDSFLSLANMDPFPWKLAAIPSEVFYKGRWGRGDLELITRYPERRGDHRCPASGYLSIDRRNTHKELGPLCQVSKCQGCFPTLRHKVNVRDSKVVVSWSFLPVSKNVEWAPLWAFLTGAKN